jgi:hypothetical protein
MNQVWRFLLGRPSVLVATALVGAVVTFGLVRFAATADASASSPVPANVQSYLYSAYGISIANLDSVPASAITADQATAVAKSSFGWVRGGSATRYLVRFTDAHAGLIAGSPPFRGTEPVTLLHVDKPVWLVTIPDAKIPIFGRHRQPSGSSTRLPGHYTATLCVFVDLVTGTYLKAVTVPT